ncbi:hypothetical protein QSJ18_04770 [Gordonia sp. ABSL1-1]|uniref:hypothetical protein n=1 Tax=Gordonia sp. ABSL1-1 TaxID=3053923 RepID=UPI0025744DEE|nr:hypothetical protein [Gordonia sp. ABSL1-1]MDL9936045.1 hypothetical protein [Gordonia sp. ABSL1-1]
MNDRIEIEPTAVKSAGGIISSEADEARRALIALFDSAQPAAAGNQGFDTGAKLAIFARMCESEINSTINDLVAVGNRIVSLASRIQAADGDTTEGISRVATALNGFGKSPLG